jgi:hypothetical protein
MYDNASHRAPAVCPAIENLASLSARVFDKLVSGTDEPHPGAESLRIFKTSPLLPKAMWLPVTKHISGLLSARVLFHLLLLRPLIRVLFRVQVERSNQFASVKQFVLVANHNSHLDTLGNFEPGFR